MTRHPVTGPGEPDEPAVRCAPAGVGHADLVPPAEAAALLETDEKTLGKWVRIGKLLTIYDAGAPWGAPRRLFLRAEIAAITSGGKDASGNWKNMISDHEAMIRTWARKARYADMVAAAEADLRAAAEMHAKLKLEGQVARRWWWPVPGEDQP